MILSDPISMGLYYKGHWGQQQKEKEKGGFVEDPTLQFNPLWGCFRPEKFRENSAVPVCRFIKKKIERDDKRKEWYQYYKTCHEKYKNFQFSVPTGSPVGRVYIEFLIICWHPITSGLSPLMYTRYIGLFMVLYALHWILWPLHIKMVQPIVWKFLKRF